MSHLRVRCPGIPVEKPPSVLLSFVLISNRIFPGTPLREFRRKYRGSLGADSRYSDFRPSAASHLQSFLSFQNPMSGIPSSIRLQKEPLVCPQCGSASRIGRSLCLNCLLAQGLVAPVAARHAEEALEDVLGELDVRDAEWRISDYQILEEIGRGGIGVVYRARHRRRIVALKRILSYHADSRETLVRFRREAETAAALVHPNILPTYEVSEGDDELPFFSTKFAGGGSLLDAAPALRSDPRRAVALMAKVTRAVQYAHGQGVLHRDLKPETFCWMDEANRW